MKSVQLSELGPVAEDVKNGETVELREGNQLVATLVPLHQARLEERVHELTARGLIRPGSGEAWPADFFTRPLAKADGSVLEQLLADRDET
jgi:antitoxin (DNA-binding transcriptional repressor) of toxin-antitoxin stability system